MKPFSLVLWIQRKRSGGEFGKNLDYPLRKKQKHIESANEDSTKRIKFDDGGEGGGGGGGQNE